MSPEQFKAAKQLEQELDSLIKARKEIEEMKEMDWNKWKLTISRKDYNQRWLLESMLPLDKEKFVAMYLLAIEQRIKEIETEFANL